jgi:DNA modification methylase
MTGWLDRCHFGDCMETLRLMPDGLVNTCVTSPPYFGLRSYLPDGVRLKTNLPADVRAAVIAELQQSGIYPLNRTTE